MGAVARARVLHLDDEEATLQLVEDSLSGDDLAFLSASTPSEALAFAKSDGPFDLVISDVNLPEMSGFGFRDALRALPGQEKTPFLFLTGADAQVEMEIATSLGSDRLLIKPFARPELRRAVSGLLKLLRSDRGNLPEALDRILSGVAENRESGVLTALAGPTMKRVVFQDGRISFAASSDPKDMIGQALVRSGLITEADLVRAISTQESIGATSGAPGKAPLLASALAVLRKVTPEQCEKVFEDKVREAVLELFLWPSGVVEYVAGAVEASDRPFPIGLDLQDVRREGLVRRGIWADVQRTLPDRGARFEVVAWPAGFPAKESDRVLARHLETGRSIAEMLVELRGQELAVMSAIARLLKANAIKPRATRGFSGSLVHDTLLLDIDKAITDVVDEPGERTAKFAAAPVPPTPSEPNLPAVKEDPAQPPQRESLPVAEVLTRALTLFREGKLQEARVGFLDVLEIDPSDPLARLRLREVEQAIATAARTTGLTDDVSVVLAVPIDSLVGKDIPSEDAFVLSRLAGNALSIADLLGVCPMPEHKVLAAIERYLADGTLKRA